jgi:Protein of unknown function (DUF2510)
MNAPGWQPDPTTRHEYRYWDGSQWTDDVSDGGVTAVDPVDGSGAAAGAGGFPSSDATSRMDPATQAYGGPVGAPPPGGAQGPGSYGGYGADPYAPSYGGSSGGMPPGPGPKKGPNPALIVAIVAIVILALGGGAFALMSGGDDDDDPQAGTTTTTAADSTTTTAGTEDTTTTTAEDTTDTSGEDTGDTANEDTIVPLIAEGIQESAPELTDEQAECIAQVIVDEVGVEQLMQMGIEGNPDDAFSQLTPEQQASLATSMLDCAPADVLAGAGA